MLRLVWRGVRFARGRAVALAAGMLVAAAAFSLLTASVEVNEADVKGVVGANWRGEYDLLVLPRASVQTIPGQHLVQVNYLSTATSGITMGQYATVAHLPGVQVAAPLEIVGYVLETADIPVLLSPAAVGHSGSRVLLITSRYTADQGLSAYPPYDDGYVYITTDRVTPLQQVINQQGGVTGPLENLPDGKKVIICPSTLPPPPAAQPSPFLRTIGLLNGSCFSRTGGAPGPVEGDVVWSFPVLVAAIDPRAEDELTGLRQAVTSGRYLAEGDKVTPVKSTPFAAAPVIASTVSFDGDTDHVTVSLLPPAAAATAGSGASQSAIMRDLGSEPESPVMHETITGAAAWHDLLAQLGNASGSEVAQILGQYWVAGPVTYRPGPEGRLDPVPVRNGVSVWTAGADVNGNYFVQAPPAAADTGFRTLTERLETAGGGRVNGTQILSLRLVGEFDPERLPGFSGSGPGSPLASYRAPLLTGADAASQAALGHQPLEPDGNVAGYAQQPPLLYTTLAGAATIESIAAGYLNHGLTGSDAQTLAPIGSIRVRVSGLRGTIREKLDKIGAIGEEIAKATGLQVIVTAGASPYPVTIGLPTGKFGRPPLPAHRGLDADRGRAARTAASRPGVAGAARAHPRRLCVVPVQRGARRGPRAPYRDRCPAGRRLGPASGVHYHAGRGGDAGCRGRPGRRRGVRPADHRARSARAAVAGPARTPGLRLPRAGRGAGAGLGGGADTASRGADAAGPRAAPRRPPDPDRDRARDHRSRPRPRPQPDRGDRPGGRRGRAHRAARGARLVRYLDRGQRAGRAGERIDARHRRGLCTAHDRAQRGWHRGCGLPEPARTRGRTGGPDGLRAGAAARSAGC